MLEEYELIDRSTAPEEADFCLIMDNELMAPLIKKGERIYVSRRQSPGDMELGIFAYKGQVYCRQVCMDYAGNLHLLCANPLHEKDNLCLTPKEQTGCHCLGKVLMKKKPPMPVYL